MFIHHADNQPTHWTLLIANGLSCRRAVRRNYDLLVHTRTVRINRHLRRAFILTVRTDRLTDDEPPTFEARMLPSRHNVAFDAGQKHKVKPLMNTDEHSAAGAATTEVGQRH